jgi:L-Ala-D/L-Glu epimerase
MKIVAAEAWRLDMRLEEPYAVAYGATSVAENVFLRLHTDDGLVGFACSAPSAAVTGETADSTLAALTETAIPRLHGEPIGDWRRLLAALVEALPHSPSVWNAVDMALHDLLAKRARLPLCHWLGAYRDRIETSITIGILPEAETVAQAEERVRQGFRCLKIKGGLHWEEDAARVRRVRETVGPQVHLRFDANQGYTVEQASRFSWAVAPAQVEFLEQPTKARDDDLRRVSDRSALPVMADESVHSPQDAWRVFTGGICRLANVKLVKCGGLDRARDIAAIASACGAGLMVGCMDESALSIAAALHFALASPAVRYADLDGHIGLGDDPAAGAVTFSDGFLFPTDRPGIGYEGAL